MIEKEQQEVITLLGLAAVCIVGMVALVVFAS